MISLCLVLAAVHAETAALGQQKLGFLKADRILFLGNSLTLHGPKPDIGWRGNWGMAASAQDKDYVHLLTAAISARTGGRLILEPTPIDGTKSVENVFNIANVLERGYATYDASKIRRQLDWKANIVVVQCGENVPADGFDATTFYKALRTMLDDLQAASDPQIFVTGKILSGNPGLDDIQRKVCAEDAAHRTFVDLSEYAATSSLNGRFGHPGDAGMEWIADRLFAAISRRAESAELSAAHRAAVNRRRRIYVNNDVGYDAVAMGPKLTPIKPEEWIASRFSAFDQPGSQVDCVGWCLDEGNIAAYPSQVIPELQYPTLLRWRSQGVDIAQRIVDESHRRNLEVFWEHRLNGADREADVTTPARHPLKDQHPEWLIEGGWWKPGLWNFAIPEVREYKLAVLREVAARYDLDGLNLDFGRHPPFLPTGRQWEQREALTDFVRQVRLMLLEVAERRGRPFLLSVRVADTVPGCHFDGLDVETWVRQRLVDMIIIGTRSIQVDLSGFKRITEGSHVKLYPCIDQHHSPDGYHAVASPEFLRGVAANWWQQGADGIATFNFWNELPSAGKMIGTTGPLRDGQSVHALAYKEIGDPKQLAAFDKWFVVSRRYGGGFYDRQGNRWDDYTNLNHQAPLPLTLGADPTWVEVSVADKLAAQTNQVERIELRLQLSAATEPDKVAVKFNGIKLQDPAIQDVWWTYSLTPRQTAQGRNLLTLDASKSGGGEKPIALEKVEVHVKYRPEIH
ncbi:MAG: family 10 glycosylhydrolase [Planctomycetales bacterium]